MYLLEASICLALFYLVFLIFKGDTFYYLKRFYLVFTVLISLIIPQLTSPELPAGIEQIIAKKQSQEIGNITYRDTFEKVVFGQIPENIFDSESKFLSLFSLLVIIYFTGVIFFLYRLLRNLFHIHHLYKQNNKEDYQNFSVILLPSDYPTFSFFNCIFLNKKNLSDEDKKDVILHEIVHIKQMHSVDILFFEICRILFWFNPAIWFYKSSVVKVHECLADQYFVDNHPKDLIDYQSLLLKQYLSKIHIELAHPFNYSLIKYRIKMMTKNKSKWWAKYKLFFALPIVVIGLVAFSNADINLDNKIGDNRNGMVTEPEGMVFIPQGSFVMKRSNGETTVERNVTVDPFWMKETEVTVIEYYEFLKSIKGKVSPEEYQLLLPDFSKEPYKNYFSSKKYYDYPVVGVSFKQAEIYCIWKTNDENKKIGTEGKPAHHAYRLPMEAEWIYASFGGRQPEEIVLPEVTALAKTGTGKPNDWGLYNIFDNVSEWTASNYVPDSLLTTSSGKYIVLFPGIEKEPSKTEFVSPSGRKMEVQFISSINYLQKDIEPTHKIVRGDNYKNQLPDGIKDLDYHQAYDYVGFRYVCSYMGNQSE